MPYPFHVVSEDPGCGCELCDVVARLAIWSIDLVDPMVDPGVDLMDGVELEYVPMSNLSFGWLNGIVVLRLYTESGLPIPPLVKDSPVPQWSPCHELPPSLQFIEDRLNDCLRNHGPTCNQTKFPDYPTQLLKLGDEPLSPIHLIETQGAQLKYAALSYCWGQAEFIRTLNSNLVGHTTGIPSSELPTVFSEAISLCHRFEIRYIWIDSLCILQDDEKDWEAGSARMAGYYSNAAFTIAATSSEDPLESFLGANKDQKYGIHRAWTWQESALSSRTIHFCRSQIWWECKTHFVPENRTEFEFGYFGYFDEKFGQAKALALAEGSPFWAWTKILHQYNERSLSRETDRLPAISGAAASIHALVGGEYYAGMWEKHLIPGLCWFISRPGFYGSAPNLATEEREPFIAPTWSWASVHGSIDHLFNPSETDFVPLIKVESITTDVPRRHLNPFGQVTGGRLEVTGRIIEGVLKWKGTGNSAGFDYPGGASGMIYNDTHLAQNDSSARRATKLDRNEPFEVRADVLVVGYSKDCNSEEENCFTFYLLVLGSMMKGEDKVFSRLGADSWSKMHFDSRWKTGGEEKTIVII
ncbi:Heterokaryon incompatibility protein (HET) domain containing protein [Rhypophila decipiens]